MHIRYEGHILLGRRANLFVDLASFVFVCLETVAGIIDFLCLNADNDERCKSHTLDVTT